MSRAQETADRQEPERPEPGTRERTPKPQSYYEDIKRRFAEERDLRLSYRPEGTAQYITDLSGRLARYEDDVHAEEVTPRDPITDTV
jgi:hypothetical protein